MSPDEPASTTAERDRRRLLLAFNLSLAFVALLVVVFALQPRLPVPALAVSPRDLSSLLGLLRRDRPSIAAGMIAMLFYGGSVLTVLPHGDGISWQSHLGGAVGGILAGILFRRLDPEPPRKRYSWEIEEEKAQRSAGERDSLEPPSPDEVPMLWHRDGGEDPRGKVVAFPPRRPQAPRD